MSRALNCCIKCGKTTRSKTSPHNDFCSKKCFDKYFDEQAFASDPVLEERIEAQEPSEVQVEKSPKLDKIEKIQWRCENDLWFLCKEILEWDILGKFHEVECGNIDRIVLDHRKCLFLWPREHLKTTILTISKTIQEILKSKGTIRILIANATADNAHLMLGQIKEIILHNEFLNLVYPWLKPKNIRQSVWREDAIKLDTAESVKKKENTVDAIGVGGNIVSRHYDIAILDDLVNPDNAKTAHGREEVITWYKYLLSIVGRKARVWAIGTRYHYYDLYDFLKKTGNYYVSEHKAISEGKILFPEEFSQETLDEIKKEQGPYIYSCQYQNQPVAEEDQQFPEKYARPFTDLPDIVQHYTLIDLVNPETVKARKDRAVVADVAVDTMGHWYLNDYVLGRLAPSEIVEAAVRFFWKYKTYRIGLNAVGYE